MPLKKLTAQLGEINHWDETVREMMVISPKLSQQFYWQKFTHMQVSTSLSSILLLTAVY